ncbi:MAG: hypothetical protein M1834_006848 [Cirrosporium novae-zelandiae]|nr:MAG: hypothetical protein M1834_006848 [Cirrosporium novae-zelandiae]
MNWTGGRLQRHSRGKKDGNSIAAIQKRHFVQVRQRQQHSQQNRSPIKLSIFNNKMIYPGKIDSADQSESEPRSYPQSRNANLGEQMKMEQFENIAAVAKRLGSTKRSRLKSSERLASNNFSSQIPMPLSPMPKSSDFEDLKQKLLKRRDWVGTAITHPLRRNLSTAKDAERVAKRRKVTKEDQLRQTAPVPLIKSPLSRSRNLGVYQPEDPSIRIGRSLHGSRTSEGHATTKHSSPSRSLRSDSMLLDNFEISSQRPDFQRNYGNPGLGNDVMVTPYQGYWRRNSRDGLIYGQQVHWPEKHDYFGRLTLPLTPIVPATSDYGTGKRQYHESLNGKQPNALKQYNQPGENLTSLDPSPFSTRYAQYPQIHRKSSLAQSFDNQQSEIPEPSNDEFSSHPPPTSPLVHSTRCAEGLPMHQPISSDRVLKRQIPNFIDRLELAHSESSEMHSHSPLSYDEEIMSSIRRSQSTINTNTAAVSPYRRSVVPRIVRDEDQAWRNFLFGDETEAEETGKFSLPDLRGHPKEYQSIFNDIGKTSMYSEASPRTSIGSCAQEMIVSSGKTKDAMCNTNDSAYRLDSILGESTEFSSTEVDTAAAVGGPTISEDSIASFPNTASLSRIIPWNKHTPFNPMTPNINHPVQVSTNGIYSTSPLTPKTLPHLLMSSQAPTRTATSHKTLSSKPIPYGSEYCRRDIRPGERRSFRIGQNLARNLAKNKTTEVEDIKDDWSI